MIKELSNSKWLGSVKLGDVTYYYVGDTELEVNTQIEQYKESYKDMI